MRQAGSTAGATVSAMASVTPGGGMPILSAWLIVRRRSFLSFSKRRYVTLTDDHVLLIDSTPVLHLVDCSIAVNAASKTIELVPLEGSGVSVRIMADSPFQYSKWRGALQTSARDTLKRYYRVDMQGLLGVGVHGIVRRGYPIEGGREESIGSGTSGTSLGEFSVGGEGRRGLFRGGEGGRNSIELDPDGHDGGIGEGMRISKGDCRILRKRGNRRRDDDGAVDHLMGRTSVAVKSVSRNGNGNVTVASEMLVAKSGLNHFGIVKVLDIFESVQEVNIVMEECLGGSLLDWIEKHGCLNEVVSRRIFLSVLKGIGYMHACGIVHWDIGPRNIMFVEGEGEGDVKIIDFGTARPIDAASGKVIADCGIFEEKGKVASLSCASPELLTSKAHRYATKADMWQLGCLLYYMLVGKLPFSKRGLQDLSISSTILSFCKKRFEQREEFLFGEVEADGDGDGEGGEGGESGESGEGRGLSGEAKHLVLKLLCPNPRMRPNAMQCLRDFKYLSDEWED